MFLWLLYVLYVLAAQWGQTKGLVGYDCTSSVANITAISLFSVLPCELDHKPQSEYLSVIQVVQQRSVSRVHTFSCLVIRSSLIHHCGMHHHTSLGPVSVGEIMHMSHTQCSDLHHFGKLAIGSGALLTGFKINETVQISITEHGYSDSEFKCRGTSFSHHGIAYYDAVMKSSYTVTLMEEWASLDLDTGDLKMSTGYTHPFKTGQSFDASAGDVFWSTQDNQDCTPTSYLVLHEGAGIIYQGHRDAKTLVVNSSTHAMAVGILGPTLVCHQPALRTEHPKIFIVMKHPGSPSFFFKKSIVDPANIDMFLYINSKLVYLERHMGYQMSLVYEHFHKRTCNIKHQLLRHLTAIAVMNPEEFAWLYSKRPGVTAVLRGELIYLMECQAVPVTIRKPSGRCYNELPVTFNNTPMYIKPRSRILVHYGSEIDCSPIVPAGFMIEGRWWALRPDSTQLPAPTTLSAEPEEGKWSYTSPHDLFKSGIYTLEELLAFQKRLLFSFEKPAISHTLSSAAANQPADLSGLDGAGLFHPGQLEEIQKNFMSKIWGWYWNISVVLGGLVGIYFIFQLIKSLINSIITCTCLYRSFGCGIEILACCFSSCAKYLLLRRHTDPDYRGGTARIRDWLQRRSPSTGQEIREDPNEVTVPLDDVRVESPIATAPSSSHPPLYPRNEPSETTYPSAFLRRS